MFTKLHKDSIKSIELKIIITYRYPSKNVNEIFSNRIQFHIKKTLRNDCNLFQDYNGAYLGTWEAFPWCRSGPSANTVRL